MSVGKEEGQVRQEASETCKGNFLSFQPQQELHSLLRSHRKLRIHVRREVPREDCFCMYTGQRHWNHLLWGNSERPINTSYKVLYTSPRKSYVPAMVSITQWLA
jgi:hypothetical protein